jgi:hypothetical protein
VTPVQMEDCRLEARKVRQMIVGDELHVGLDALWTDVRGRPFIWADALRVECDNNAIIVRKQVDGYYVDLCLVPATHRFERRESWTVPVRRVRGVANGGCPAA